MFFLLAFSAAELLNADIITANDNPSNNVLVGATPLTANEIATAWPHLPNATELYNSGKCIVLDLRYAGKQSAIENGFPSGLPDENSPTIYNMTSAIANYTSNDPIIELGTVVQNDPHIMLEYNSSIYVEVPPSYLQTTVQPYATAIQQLTNARLPSLTDTSTQTPQTQSTWAAGEYDDPSQISGSNPITGSITYGEWTQNTLGSSSSYYTAVDVLSVLTSDGYWLQDAMMINQNGFYIEYNVWLNGNLQPIQTYTPWTAHGWTPSLNTYYNTFVQKQGNYWDFCWNYSTFYQLQDTGTSTIVVGNQSNACVESNDFNQNDWTYPAVFSTCIGGDYTTGGVNYCLPAAGFYYNNNWYPLNHGDNCPAAYVWNASKAMSGWTGISSWPNGGPGGTGQGPPPVWGGTTSIGVRNPYPLTKEILQVYYNGKANQGYQLWSEGGF